MSNVRRPVIAASSAISLVVAAAALWALARWSLRRARSFVWLVGSGGLVAICFALVMYGLFFSQALSARPRLPLESFFLYILVPLFICMPFAVTLGVSQLSVRLRVSGRVAQGVSFLSGLGTALVLPFTALAAGCGLAGACL
jgi:hypothetical protein